MRWPIFLAFAFVFLVLDGSLMGVLTLSRIGGIAPNLLIVLLVFICLFASRTSVLGGALVLGLLLDLTLPYAQGPALAGVHVIGPHALGFTFAAFVVLQLRTMVFRQRVVTIAALSFAAVIAAAIVAIMILVVRSWYGESTLYFSRGSAAGELLRQAGIGLYTALLALPLGWALLASTPLWGFQSGQMRRAMWR